MVIVSMFTLAFSEVWNNSYNEIMNDPFWKNGNILLVLIYAVLYVFISSFFGAFHLGYYTELSLIGSQVIGTLATNTISFVIISLIGRGRLSVKPMIYLTVYEFFILVLWVYVFSALFARLYPPRRMVIIYGNKNAADLIRKMGKRGDKYFICEAVSCEESFEEITARIDEYEAVIINDIPHELRSEILKYCLEKSIRVYINPKISDIIIRGADDFNMFDTPPFRDALSAEDRDALRVCHHMYYPHLKVDRYIESDVIPLLDSDPAAVRADAYDMVCNGVEVGGGSIRIHDRELQNRMFRALGLDDATAQRKFGCLLGAFEYGAPPHAGLAFGLDRVCAMIVGQDSIRDFIAFPKNNSGRDLMDGSPTEISQEQLDELGLQVVRK